MSEEESNNPCLILKKRLNTCRSSSGRLTNPPDDLVVDIVRQWEQWQGTGKSFYQALGLKKGQLGPIMKKGKKLFREGKQKLGPFVPVGNTSAPSRPSEKIPIILRYNKRDIRFYKIDHLLEFLKKSS